jgi:murein DD-endopeptidase MepM/ murein hydrolase activator NlpD
MESIIASQKIGRRRRVTPGRAPQEKRRKSSRAVAVSYPSVIVDSQLRLPGPGHRFPGLGHRFPGLGRRFPGPLARLGLALPRARSKLREAKPALVVGIGLAAIAALVAIIASGRAFPMPDAGLLPAEDSAQNLLLDYVSPELSDGRADSGDDAAPLPPAPATLELATYTVKSGDSIGSIAKRFGLYVDTIISANGISSSSSVRPGTQLRIPNINGLIQKVRPGESLASIAKRYKTDATRIVDANDLGTSRLIVGQSLFIPGARLPDSDIKQAMGQKFAWPARGPLSSFFGYRPDPFTGVRRFHAGIDIVVDAGTTVTAAMDGKVADVGYNGNYGNYVILSHAGGFQTLYGHLTSYSVAVGATVSQGSPLGLSGNTGYSTGPHLHFGLFRRSAALNPLKYLK